MDEKYIQQLLEMNKNKNFVQRILSPESFPKTKIDGFDATHMMAWGDDGNGNYFVYPTIVYDPKTKLLNILGNQDAFNYAMRTKEYIPFNSAEEADWFSKNYKRIWDKKK